MKLLKIVETYFIIHLNIDVKMVIDLKKWKITKIIFYHLHSDI